MCAKSHCSAQLRAKVAKRNYISCTFRRSRAQRESSMVFEKLTNGKLEKKYPTGKLIKEPKRQTFKEQEICLIHEKLLKKEKF